VEADSKVPKVQELFARIAYAVECGEASAVVETSAMAVIAGLEKAMASAPSSEHAALRQQALAALTVLSDV